MASRVIYRKTKREIDAAIRDKMREGYKLIGQGCFRNGEIEKFWARVEKENQT